MEASPKGSLTGARVLLTRQLSDSVDLAELIRGHGGEAVCLPMVRIAPPGDADPLHGAKEWIEKFDWVVLTSRHAVSSLLKDLPVPGGRRPKISAVGESTAAAVRHAGWPLDFVASGKGGAALAEEMMEQEELSGAAVLYPCSNLAGDEVMKRFHDAGAEVTSVEAYRTLPPDGADEKVQQTLGEVLDGRIDIAVFASPSAARHFRELVNREDILQNLTAVSIGKTTAAELKAQGATRVIEAQNPNTEGLFRAVKDAWSDSAKGRSGS